MSSEETWKEIWERKGNQEGGRDDLINFDGYERTNIDMEEVVRCINKELQISKGDRVLEVGCGAGALAQYLDCDYVGIDYSSSLVKKHINLLGNSVLVGEANDLIFKDNSFDIVICYGVFMYFDNKNYVGQVINELKRVARKKIFIGDLPMQSHRSEHLLFSNDELAGWRITEGFYDPYRQNRFNATLII